MSKSGKKDDNQTFDMYHFFSRKDVILAAALIIALLLLMLWAGLFSGGLA